MQQTKDRQAILLCRVLLGLVASAIALLATIPILAVALPFWLVAVLTRAMLPLFRPSVVRWPELYEFYPRLGWKAKSNINAYCLEEREMTCFRSRLVRMDGPVPGQSPRVRLGSSGIHMHSAMAWTPNAPFLRRTMFLLRPSAHPGITWFKKFS
jgi:hypothetical protein